MPKTSLPPASASSRSRVIITLLGSTLDTGFAPKRWDRWRPTVALGQLRDLQATRIELIYEKSHETLQAQVLKDLSLVSPQLKTRAWPIEIADPWDFERMYALLHDFARAYPFDVEQEEYLINITTGTHVAQICLFLLTEARFLPGRLLQLAPGSHAAPTPGTFRTIDLDLSQYDMLAQRFHLEQVRGQSVLKSGIETRNIQFNALIERIEQVAIGSKAPILLMGPTGAGKSQLARRIYQLKRERGQLDGPSVEVNCAMIRGDGAMSTLFGHVRGAFTGAQGDRPGLLKSAEGGLLFLDEIGELGLDEQAMLLRAIEARRFLPVGSDKEVSSHFQLIAGTNRDLSAEVRLGRFREDLLARINLWTFRLPPLRQRLEDLEPNLEYELERFIREEKRRVSFSREARVRFLELATGPEALWRANFRDLNAAMTRMCTLAPGGRITVLEVEEELERLRQSWWGDGVPEEAPLPVRTHPVQREDLDIPPYPLPLEIWQTLDRFERVQLQDVLRVCHQSRSLAEAGRELFGASRQQKRSSNDTDRLRKYLARYGLEWDALSRKEEKE